MTTLVLSNPHSKHATRQVPALSSLSAVVHEVTEAPAAVPALVAKHRLGSDDVLVLHGGDGTIQNGLTALLNEGRSAAELPIIAMLPGGTTNMTAGDINRSRNFTDCVATLSRGRVDVRIFHVVSVDSTDVMEKTRYGFFFGAGAIVHGIRYFHDHAQVAGLGSAVALGRAIWGIYRRQPPYADAVEISVDGCKKDRLLILATTLTKLIIGTTPYWGSGAGGLKVTSIEQQAERLLRSLARLLRGREPLANGYRSINLDRVRLQFQGPYTLDGEIFDNRGESLEIAALPLRVWRL